MADTLNCIIITLITDLEVFGCKKRLWASTFGKKVKNVLSQQI